MRSTSSRQAFHGFGFSGKPTKAGAIFRVGDLWHTLMTEVLGYERFAAHGGD